MGYVLDNKRESVVSVLKQAAKMSQLTKWLPFWVSLGHKPTAVGRACEFIGRGKEVTLHI